MEDQSNLSGTENQKPAVHLRVPTNQHPSKLSKVFDRVILHQLTENIEKEIIYDQQQSEFKRGHSKTTIYLKLKEDIVGSMKREKSPLPS